MDTGKYENSETIHNLYITRFILYQTLHTFATFNLSIFDYCTFTTVKFGRKIKLFFFIYSLFLQSIFLQILLAKFLCFKYLIMILYYDSLILYFSLKVYVMSKLNKNLFKSNKM